MNWVKTAPVPDEELVRRLAGGLGEPLESLHARYGSFLTTVATRAVDRPAAEEIVQDVFLTVWQHADRFDTRRGSFRNWVLQITRRRILNELRRRRSRLIPEMDPDGRLLETLTDATPELADRVVVDERRSAVRVALHILSQSERQAITLAFFNELTHEEVACATSVPLGTTKTRIRRGLMKLRVELSRR
ncbi:MAG: sigma-70 family RNA polymerase sigma factor [Chloroflexi bacterium]|nr:sigma-70 family RNA polymerase sigma factor [Chloroflexota bacterium]